MVLGTGGGHGQGWTMLRDAGNAGVDARAPSGVWGEGRRGRRWFQRGFFGKSWGGVVIFAGV
jgi:hypothetical protein